jgi:hypothetical protein
VVAIHVELPAHLCNDPVDDEELPSAAVPTLVDNVPEYVKVPSYDSNSINILPGAYNAKPSGAPFSIPLDGKDRTVYDIPFLLGVVNLEIGEDVDVKARISAMVVYGVKFEPLINSSL